MGSVRVARSLRFLPLAAFLLLTPGSYAQDADVSGRYQCIQAKIKGKVIACNAAPLRGQLSCERAVGGTFRFPRQNACEDRAGTQDCAALFRKAWFRGNDLRTPRCRTWENRVELSHDGNPPKLCPVRRTEGKARWRSRSPHRDSSRKQGCGFGSRRFGAGL